MKVTMKRDAFLANTQNKKRFITLLWGHLEDSGCRTLQADGDADVLIVRHQFRPPLKALQYLLGTIQIYLFSYAFTPCKTDATLSFAQNPSPPQHKSKYGT